MFYFLAVEWGCWFFIGKRKENSVAVFFFFFLKKRFCFFSAIQLVLMLRGLMELGDCLKFHILLQVCIETAV